MPLPTEIQGTKASIKKKGSLGFRVVTGSMEPVIMTNEMIEVVPVEFADLRVFDIVLFWSGTQLICHYLWHINRIPQSDGSHDIVTRSLRGREDIPTPWEHVLGKIASHRIPAWRKTAMILKHLAFRR